MKTFSGSSTYDQKCQNVVGENIETEQGHNKRITDKDDHRLPVQLSSIKQHNRDEEIVLHNQDNIFEVVRPPIVVCVVIESRHAVADHLDGQRLQGNPFGAFLSINRENLWEFRSERRKKCFCENCAIHKTKPYTKQEVIVKNDRISPMTVQIVAILLQLYLVSFNFHSHQTPTWMKNIPKTNFRSKITQNSEEHGTELLTSACCERVKKLTHRKTPNSLNDVINV